MERHIGIWKKEASPSFSEVGELLIDGNQIEFYSRFPCSVFAETFIGRDEQLEYKVFVKGGTQPGQNRVIYSNAKK